MRKPGRRIAGFLIVAAVLGGLVTGLNWVSANLYPEDSNFLHQIDTVWQQLPEAEAITIGGSTAGSIDFTELGKRGLAAHLPGTDPFEAEALLELLLPRAQALKTVYYPVDPVMLAVDNAYSNVKRRRTYYRILNQYGHWELIVGDWRNALAVLYLPLVRSDGWWQPMNDVHARLFGRNPPPAATSSAPTETRTAEKMMVDEIAKRSALAIDKISGNLYRHPDIPSHAAEAIVRVNRKLRARGIQLVLFEPPVTTAYLDHVEKFAAQFEDGFNATLETCRREGAIVVSYRNHPLFVNQYDLFDNANHLNRLGSKLFSQRLRADMSTMSTSVGRLTASPAPAASSNPGAAP